MEHVTEECTCEGKKCIGCQQVRCFGHFGIRKKDKPVIPTNLNSYCRPCDSQRGGEAIKQRRRENTKRWRETHLEQARVHTNKWQKAHPDIVKEHARRNNRKRFEADPDGERERKRLWNRAHYAERRTEARILDTRMRAKQSVARMRVEQPEKYRLRGQIKSLSRRVHKLQASGKFTMAEWSKLKEEYDYTCLSCKRREPEIKLTVDHVIPLCRGGTHSIENIQPLCKSCNSIKGKKFIDFRPKTP